MTLFERSLLPSLVVLALFFGGCASSPGIRPHDLSVEGHEKAAADDERNAKHFEALAEANPSGTDYVSNWGLADTYHQHAEDHRKAAVRLSKSSDPEACSADPDAEKFRTACPLAVYKVAAVSNTEHGVSVTYADADAEHLRSHIRCHLAHATMMKEQHADADSCPLMGAEVTTKVTASEGGAVLLIESTDAATTTHIQGIYVSKTPAG